MIRTVVVDDDFRVAELHHAFVDRLDGFRVVGDAHTGEQAIDAVMRLRPDLVVLDLYLPDIPGLEVLRRIRALDGPRPDVIAVTAARDVESLRSAMQGGVVHYLVKPFTFSAFREKLQSYAVVRARMLALSEADQTEVDRLYAMLRSPAETELPKGLSEGTLRLIVDVLRRARTDLTSSGVAQVAGVSRVTARRYLDQLCRAGRVEMTLSYGAPGRPEHRYRLAEPARHGDERAVRGE